MCPAATGPIRTYYIRAEPVEWSYYDEAAAAAGTDSCADGAPMASNHYKFLRRAIDNNGENLIGTQFTKARYVAYTDATFTTRVSDNAAAGILGPTIRAEVGDVIVVVARNALPFNVSFHPHGVQYGKGAEGAPYADASSAGELPRPTICFNGGHAHRPEAHPHQQYSQGY